jgi:hypothetical protein
MLVHGTRRPLAALTGAVLLVCAGRAGASRCGTALISGGLKAECPSVDDARLPACPAGTTRVVYRLDRPGGRLREPVGRDVLGLRHVRAPG